MKYVAFLRGINVGGHAVIKMQDLSKMFSAVGLSDVKTYIASGNVSFESTEKDSQRLTKKIETGLEKALGYSIHIMLRTTIELERIMKNNPFKKIKNAEAKTYITFLKEKPTHQLKLPFLSVKKDVEILEVSDREVYSLSLPLPKGRFGNPIPLIEKEIGKPSTTRNWKTIERIMG